MYHVPEHNSTEQPRKHMFTSSFHTALVLLASKALPAYLALNNNNDSANNNNNNNVNSNNSNNNDAKNGPISITVQKDEIGRFPFFFFFFLFLFLSFFLFFFPLLLEEGATRDLVTRTASFCSF